MTGEMVKLAHKCVDRVLLKPDKYTWYDSFFESRYLEKHPEEKEQKNQRRIMATEF